MVAAAQPARKATCTSIPCCLTPHPHLHPFPSRLTLLSCTKLGGSARVTVTRTFCSSLYVSLAILSLSV